MSIFSSIKSAVSNYAKNVVGGAKIVGGAISSAIGSVSKALSGSGQMAGVATYNKPAGSLVNQTTPQTALAGKSNSSSNGISVGNSFSLGGGSSGSGSSAPFYPTPTGQPINVAAGTRSTLPGTASTPLAVSNVQVPKTISADMLMDSGYSSASYSPGSSSASTYNPVSLPTAPSTTKATFDINSILTPALASQGYTVQNNQLVGPQVAVDNTETPEQTKWKKIMNSLKGMLPEPPSTEETYTQLEEKAGLTAKKNLVNSLNSQLNGIVSKRDADLLNLRGIGAKEGVTETVYGGQQSEIEREAAIKALPVAAQLSAAQADLQTAQDYVTKYFSIISQDNEKKFEYQWKLLDSVMSIADKEEQRQIDAKKEQVARNSTLMTNSLNFSQTIASEALKNGNQAAFSRITSLATPDPYSPTFTQDIQNYNAKIASYGKAVGASSGVTGADAPLYAGLNSATATAVRQVVSGFKSEPQVTNFSAIQDGYNFTKTISNKTTNPADDQALIYSLAKVLDPGSVVREGEYATAQKYAQSWIQAYGKSVTQAINGTGFLSETARQNIKSTVQTKYNSSLKTYKNIYNQYTGQINNLTGRADGTKFLRDYAIAETQNSQSSSQSGGLNLSDLNFSF